MMKFPPPRPTVQCSAFPPQSSPTHKIHNHQRAVGRNAHHLLDKIPLRGTFEWNALIRAHLADGEPRRALIAYHHMLHRGSVPDNHTLPHVLLAASRLPPPFFDLGKQAHAQAHKLALASDTYILTALIELYARFEGARSAAAVFRRSGQNNPVAWTLLAKIYTAEGDPESALQSFYRITITAPHPWDSAALVAASDACIQLKSLRHARKVHDAAVTAGLELSVIVANSLTKMYVECGRLGEARALFERMPYRDAVSWTTMIHGYLRSGGFHEALKLFRSMCVEGVWPDAYAVSAVLPACARMAAHKHGKEIHCYIVRNGIRMNLVIDNALVDMYAKSGNIESATRIFERMLKKDAISWTVMISGCSLHGQGELGVALSRTMEEPDREAYAAALRCCSAACVVDEGRLFFDRIRNPGLEHYALMVGLLSRAGLFDEARAFVDRHRIGQHAAVLRALLDGYRIHRDARNGKRIVEQLIELEPLNAENYVLLMNNYASQANWEMVEKLRETIRDMGLKPKAAYSWIEVRSKVHVFGVGDVSHPRSERIYWELKGLMKRMEEEGHVYVGGEDFSLHDVHEERECIPYGHSEMLAIAFGLISTQGSNTNPVRVTKNLRVCRNCHALAKSISKVAEREIILKDPERFHHFRDGSCSCGDM